MHRTNWQEPCIVFSPNGSLRLGPVVHLLRHWCGDQNSLLVLEVLICPVNFIKIFDICNVVNVICLHNLGTTSLMSELKLMHVFISEWN